MNCSAIAVKGQAASDPRRNNDGIYNARSEDVLALMRGHEKVFTTCFVPPFKGVQCGPRVTPACMQDVRRSPRTQYEGDLLL